MRKKKQFCLLQFFCKVDLSKKLLKTNFRQFLVISILLTYCENCKMDRDFSFQFNPFYPYAKDYHYFPNILYTRTRTHTTHTHTHTHTYTHTHMCVYIYINSKVNIFLVFFKIDQS